MRVKLLCLFGMLMLAGAVDAPAASLQQMMDGFGVQQPSVKKLAPDFTLTGVDGGQVKLSDLRGKLVLLHFWATWCVPCRHEMPLLHQLDRDGLKQFRIVCINVNRGDSVEVKAFMDKVTPHFHSLLDPSGEVRNQYAIRGLPTSYLIAADGKIIGRMIGERDWSSAGMKELIQRLTKSNKSD